MNRCLRNTLVTMAVVILLGGFAGMTAAGAGILISSSESRNEAERKSIVRRAALVMGFSPVPFFLALALPWLACGCGRRILPRGLFICYLTLAVIFFVGGFATMLTFGIIFLEYNESKTRSYGSVLIAFSVIPIGVAIGLPIYCCYRRKRQIQEDNANQQQYEENHASPSVLHKEFSKEASKREK